MASVDDIAAMKLSAIGSRGSRKDFYDLYQIYHIEPGFQSERLINAVHQKFGQDFDMTYMVMALNYFENAETETLPKLFVHADWDQIKQFFTENQISKRFRSSAKNSSSFCWLSWLIFRASNSIMPFNLPIM